MIVCTLAGNCEDSVVELQLSTRHLNEDAGVNVSTIQWILTFFILAIKRPLPLFLNKPISVSITIY